MAKEREEPKGGEGEAAPKGSEAPPRPPRSRAIRWLRRVALALLVLTLSGVVVMLLVLRHFEADLPPIDELSRYRPPGVTRVLARDGTVLGELFVERRTVISIADVPNHVKLAVLAAEDASFYEHEGLNYLGMLRALWVNLRTAESRQGGSTITQQVVKNVLLSPEKTYERKVREVLLARRIEAELTKEQILELYLNQIYFGHGRYGIEEASRFYFGKGVRDVSLAEAAILAGVIKGPGFYSPRSHPERAAERRSFVLDQMLAKGFAPKPLVDASREEVVNLAPDVPRTTDLAPEVVEVARKKLHELGLGDVERGGYTITTTIDPRLQQAARDAVRKNLDEHARRQKLLAPLSADKRRDPKAFEGPLPTDERVLAGVVTGADDAKGLLFVRVGDATGVLDLDDAARFNPKALPASRFAEVGKVLRVRRVAPSEGAAADAGSAPRRLRLALGAESALVAVDVRSREVLALIGGYGSERGNLDRARSAHRQPGSTFKPFVYGYAIHSRRFTAASLVETSPAKIPGYTLRGDATSPPTRLREALAASLNPAAVWILRESGAANVAAFATSLGITSKLGTDLSLALGSYEVTPFEMAGAYATLASGGEQRAPTLILRITGPDGREIPLGDAPPPQRALDEAEAYVVTSLLTSVVERGTGRGAKALGRPVAGKTGTSNRSRDAWFVGYTPDLVCAVWTGYDDATSLGAGEMGATAALPAFVDFMRAAHKGKPAADFPVPAGVVRLRIDPVSGLLARPEQEDAIDEVFLLGTEPRQVAPLDAGVYDELEATRAGAVDGAAGAGGHDAAAGSAPAAGAGGAPPHGDEPPPF
jgi:penicillin-binding protein 1A